MATATGKGNRRVIGSEAKTPPNAADNPGHLNHVSVVQAPAG